VSLAAKEGLSRISISLPAHLLRQLDDMVRRRGFESRSQAIVEMVNDRLAQYNAQAGD